jgi:hypothetical protein
LSHRNNPIYNGRSFPPKGGKHSAQNTRVINPHILRLITSRFWIYDVLLISQKLVPQLLNFFNHRRTPKNVLNFSAALLFAAAFYFFFCHYETIVFYRRGNPEIFAAGLPRCFIPRKDNY